MTSRTSFSADTQQTAGANTGNTNFYTNNTGFFARQRELFKRRLWPAALTFLGFLLYNVIGLATALSAANQDAIGERLSAAERAVLFHDVLEHCHFL